MAAGDIFGVGVSGLMSFQRALNTTGHNISNVNTEGYSRQRVELASREPTPSGAGFLGNGVRAVTTRRIWDEHAVIQVRSRTSSAEYFKVYEEMASQVDNLLADPDAGMSPALEDFFDSVQGVADDPTSISAREVLLSGGRALVDRFHTMEQWLADLRKTTNDRIKNLVTDVNSLADSIADINQEIIVATGIGRGQPPNDLMDQRDHLIDQLSEKIGITVVPQENSTYNIFIGNGQSLVLGTTPMHIEARPNPDDPMNYEVAYYDPANTGQLFSISQMLTGGELGGVLAFREEVLDPSFNHLGRLALGMALTFNEQHKLGMDLANSLGGDFFVEPSAEVTASVYNTGVGTISVAFRDPVTNAHDAGSLTTADYEMTFLASGDYELRNLATGQATVLAAAAGPTYAVDGMFIDVTGWAPAVDDVINIRPTRGGARGIDMAFDDPNLIAAADPIRTNANVANLGDATITEATITDITNVNLLTPVTIQFRDSGAVPPLYANEFSVDGGVTWVAYTDPSTITTAPTNGWQVTISGTPMHGDTFTVGPNTTGFSDNRNALALADMQSRGTLEGGSATYHEAYSTLVVNVGNDTRQAQINQSAQEALRNQAQELREAISGVNLDEEAANLLRFQQAYAAAAQVISTADQLFQTLLTAVRR